MHYYREFYDVDRFRIIYVTFSENHNLYNFDDLLELWMHMYDSQVSFRFIFDTRQLQSIPPILYALRMTYFIYRLKKRPHHYLERSLILVNKKGISRMLDFIFSVQSPVAPVYILNCEEPPDKREMIDLIIQKDIVGDDITEILP